MNKEEMRIVFMGTPDFAALHLERLVKERYNVVGVFSQPDKASGRGSRKRPTPVKKSAEKHDIPVFQPKSVNLRKGFESLRALNPDVIVVVAFGKILKKKVITLPPMGIYNVHASILPKYRGAAPIQRAIENGETETGVSIMKIVPELDAGDVARIERIPIGKRDNLETVHDKLVEAGSAALCAFLKDLSQDRVTFTSQNDDEATYAGKIEKDELYIDWNREAGEIHNKIRAFDPIPCARTILNAKTVKLMDSMGPEDDKIQIESKKKVPGTILKIVDDGAWIKCGNGCLLVGTLQLPSKKPVTFMDAKNGRKISEGEMFKPCEE